MTKQGKTATTNYGVQNRDAYFQEWTNYPNTLIFTQGMTTRHHPTEKPLDLFEYLVKTYTNEGFVVMDNCAGSFTTAVACKSSSRKWICIEKEEKYCKIGEERLKEVEMVNV